MVHVALEWTHAQNVAMMGAMDLNGDGKVSKSEFVFYCSQLLPQDEYQFMALCDNFTEIGMEAEKSRETASKRAENNARHARHAKPESLAKYGVATKLYNMQQSRDQEQEMRRGVRNQLEERKQRSEADYRSRGRLVRRREQQVKDRALELARAWRDEQLSDSDEPDESAERAFWGQMLQGTEASCVEPASDHSLL